MGPNSSGDGKKRKQGNFGLNPFARNAEKQKWAMLLRGAVPSDFPGFGSSPVNVVVVRSSSGIMDHDNAVASMKFVLDGLVGAGVIEDDNPRIVSLRVVQADRSRKKSGLVIFVFPKDDEQIRREAEEVRWANDMAEYISEGQVVSTVMGGKPAIPGMD